MRVILAEDDVLLREALVELIHLDDSLTLVGVAADADEAIALARSEQPDVALLDVRMPGGGGQRAATEIGVVSPGTRSLALTAYEDRATILSMVRAGVSGYLVKGATPDEVVDAILRVAAGGAVLADDVTSEILTELIDRLDEADRVANARAEIETAKHEIIQLLSHEILTPATVLIGSAETIARRVEATPDAPDALGAVVISARRAADQLQRLCRHIGAITEIAHPRELEIHSTGLGQLVDRAITHLRPDDRRRVILKMTDRAASAQVAVAGDLAAWALAAVIENGLRFSPEDSLVDVTGTVDTEVHIDVTDRGPGIPADLGERAFDAFTQGDASTTRERGGTGIGLYVAQRIVNAHAGQMGADAGADGGTVVHLVLPRSPSAAA